MATQLSVSKKGIPLWIKELAGDADFQRFFRHIGLRVGDPLTLVNIINHHYIIHIKGSRYAMEKALADHVMVVDHD